MKQALAILAALFATPQPKAPTPAPTTRRQRPFVPPIPFAPAGDDIALGAIVQRRTNLRWSVGA